MSSETISSWPSPVRLNLGSDSLASSCLTEVITGVTSQRGLNSSQDKHGPKPPVQSLTKSGLTFKKMVGVTSHLCFVYISSHGSKSVLLVCTLVLCSFNCSLVGGFQHNWLVPVRSFWFGFHGWNSPKLCRQSKLNALTVLGICIYSLW